MKGKMGGCKSHAVRGVAIEGKDMKTEVDLGALSELVEIEKL